MKKFIYGCILLFIVIVIKSCAVRPMLYHSEAELPYFSKTILTNFELIKKNEKSKIKLKFGIITATDNNKLKYILIAPGRNVVDDIPDVLLYHSITLLDNQAKELLNTLEYSIKKWNENIPKLKGENIECMIAPEQEIIPQSENVVSWYPTLKFNFQNNSKGPLAIFIIGEGLIKYYYEFKTVESLRHIRDLMKIALDKLN